MKLVQFVLRWWTAFALAASLSLLAVAIIVFEWGLGYAPCHLCIQQRWIYAGVALIGAIGWIWGLLLRPAGTPKPIAFLILLGFAWETYVAVFHAGVEYKWWRGPATCTGGGTVDVAAIRNLLNGGAVHTPMCDVAVWSFGGLSMAGWNAVAAAMLTLISLAALLRRDDRRVR